MLHMLGPKLKFSSAFQPLTDCQTEVVHKSALSSFASHVHVESYHDLHKEVMDEIAQHNANYEMRIDVRKLFKTFNIGDVVLRAFSNDPFQILKKLNCNIYVIDFGISSIFSLEDLVGITSVLILILATFYWWAILWAYFWDILLFPNSKYFTQYSDQIYKILDDEVIMTRKYWVRWKGSALNDDSWKGQSNV